MTTARAAGIASTKQCSCDNTALLPSGRNSSRSCCCKLQGYPIMNFPSFISYDTLQFVLVKPKHVFLFLFFLISSGYKFGFDSKFSFFPISFLHSCLNAVRILQKNGHVPSDPAVFKSYAEYGHFVDIRIAALEAVVDYTKGGEDNMALCVCFNKSRY